jgi:hypothetical protein
MLLWCIAGLGAIFLLTGLAMICLNWGAPIHDAKVEIPGGGSFSAQKVTPGIIVSMIGLALMGMSVKLSPTPVAPSSVSVVPNVKANIVAANGARNSPSTSAPQLGEKQREAQWAASGKPLNQSVRAVQYQRNGTICQGAFVRDTNNPAQWTESFPDLDAPRTWVENSNASSDVIRLESGGAVITIDLPQNQIRYSAPGTPDEFLDNITLINHVWDAPPAGQDFMRPQVGCPLRHATPLTVLNNLFQ